MKSLSIALNFPPPKAEGYCFGVVRPSFRPSGRHFCVRSHILEVLWRISLKLGMSIYMDKTMMHAKWHCTPSVNNGVMALCILKNAFYYGTFVSGTISWKCFGGFHWNLVWVYIRIRGWCTPNGIVHHLLITELWPFVYILCQCSMWGYKSRLWQSFSLAGDINSTNLLVYI